MVMFYQYHLPAYFTIEVIIRQHFNDLTDEIILNNYTYNEKDFAIIRSFKEEQLPAVHVSTDEDYRHVEHLYMKSKLTFKEVDELQDEYVRSDIRFNISRIDSWYIKCKSKLIETKTAKKK
ncbi:uncharacterized protein OCT59_014336 [Rhizophagus irregularis]|uniref:uncharacterized protein n=1 Tax=Rhizophagus irregularis TaxID=588596 RepID=UPI001C1A3F78|nr:hypothetical protein OCT59_014336 [Rhizophagus irregularis]CAB5179299.1 unnamed protein product [Rhizophagus irregularis]